jgi:hypothetical protein
LGTFKLNNLNFYKGCETILRSSGVFAYLKTKYAIDQQGQKIFFFVFLFLYFNFLLQNLFIYSNANANPFSRQGDGGGGNRGLSISTENSDGKTSLNSIGFSSLERRTKIKNSNSGIIIENIITKYDKTFVMFPKDVGKRLLRIDRNSIIIASEIAKDDINKIIENNNKASKVEEGVTIPAVKNLSKNMKPKNNIDFYSMSLDELSNISVSAGP